MRMTIFLSATLALASAARAADFNGDHIDDLVAQSRGPGDPNLTWHGRVTVLYGTLGVGPSTTNIDTFDPGTFGFADDYAEFGHALAAGDFDGDGFDDLAIGVPGAAIDGRPDAGCVVVIPGSASGLDAARATAWTQDSPGVADRIEDPFELEGHPIPERFGTALAAGDFDEDGRDDLAIGVAESTSKVAAAGAVHLLHGSWAGLISKKKGRLRFVHQGTSGIAGTPENFDQFGNGLRAADLDGDGQDDLAVQSLGEETTPGFTSGAITLLFGSHSGISKNHDVAYGAKKLGESPEFGLSIGEALCAGDFDGNGKSELVIGMPGHADSAGRVVVARLPKKKIEFDSLRSIDAHDVDAGVTPAENDWFGQALASADFDHDGFADLAIGMPGAQVFGLQHAGLVGVLRGGPNGLVTPGAFIGEGVGGVTGETGQFNNSGRTLTAGDFNGDGFGDLVIGAPRESIEITIIGTITVADVGVLTVVYGAAGGLGTGGSVQLIDPNGLEAFTQFGTTLAP